MRRLFLVAAFAVLAACEPEWGSRLVLKLEGDPAQMTETVKVLRRRLAEAGDRYTTIEPLGADQIEVRAPGVADSLGMTRFLTRPGKLSFHLVDVYANPTWYQLGVEHNGRIVLSDETFGTLRLTVIFADPVVTNADISNARSGNNPSTGPDIGFELNPAGAKRFGKATTENVGRPFAIVLDDRIIMAPNIQSPIMGGTGRITGRFTQEETDQMAMILRAGALPARLTLVETATFGGK
jgi:protein-export membrane protein SecD